MRIANNRTLSGQKTMSARAALLVAVVMTSFFASAAAHAVDTPPASFIQPPAAAGGMVMPPPMPSSVTPSAPMPPSLVQSQSTKIDSGLSDINKNVAGMEDKASDNAKNTIKHLEASSDAITLEDLNVARQAIVRLDAMIDVEKHLGELEKMRSERTGNSHSLANAIPASALTPSPVAPPSPPPAAIPQMPSLSMRAEPVAEHAKPVEKKTATMEVTRISGIDGVYTAVLKLDDGAPKTVKVGEHLSGNTIVRSISPSSVVVEVGGEIRNLHVKNIDVLYSAMR